MPPKAMDPVLERADVKLITGRPLDQAPWIRDLAEHEARLEEITVDEHNRPSGRIGELTFLPNVLPLSLVRAEQVRTCTAATELKVGDTLTLAVRGVALEILERNLGVAPPQEKSE